MVKLRLTRTGKTHNPSYRVVAINSINKRNGEALEYVGFYNPKTKEKSFDKDRISYWLSKGAQASDTVKNLLIKEGIVKQEKGTTKKFNKKPGKKATERNAKKAEKAAASEQKEN